MKTVRSVLNELWWRSDRNFSKVLVEYIHRGAPGDLSSVAGPEILELAPWMMVVRRSAGDAPMRAASPVPGQAAIPYHRIVRVRYDGEVVFGRSPGASQKAS